jgi:hypothetical protein
MIPARVPCTNIAVWLGSPPEREGPRFIICRSRECSGATRARAVAATSRTSGSELRVPRTRILSNRWGRVLSAKYEAAAATRVSSSGCRKQPSINSAALAGSGFA